MKNLVNELRKKVNSIETCKVSFVGIDEYGEVNAVSEYDLPCDFDEAVKNAIEETQDKIKITVMYIINKLEVKLIFSSWNSFKEFDYNNCFVIESYKIETEKWEAGNKGINSGAHLYSLAEREGWEPEQI